MLVLKREKNPLVSAAADAQIAGQKKAMQSELVNSPAYKLAYQDEEFLLRPEMRAVRLQLELLKPDMLMDDAGIESTVVIFGSARILDPERAQQKLLEAEAALSKDMKSPDKIRALSMARRMLDNSVYYAEARKLGRLISKKSNKSKLVVITGGGPGIMEAANRGAHDKKAKSIGLNIVLPHEQEPNPYITPELNFQFHYFAIRKMHFLMRAKALIAFPGGFGTLDELFETLTLIQTHKVRPIPVLLFGKEFWNKIVCFEALADEGMISHDDLNYFKYVETAEDAWGIILKNGTVSGTKL